MNNSRDEPNMARRFWNVMPCSLVIFGVPQPEYPYDIGGRFLQKRRHVSEHCFCSGHLENPKSRGGGGEGCRLYIQVGGCLETDR